jgi:hypothetical protein
MTEFQQELADLIGLAERRHIEMARELNMISQMDQAIRRLTSLRMSAARACHDLMEQVSQPIVPPPLPHYEATEGQAIRRVVDNSFHGQGGQVWN